MSLKNLTKNLENFKWTNYSNVGNNSAPPSNGGNLEPPELIKDQKKKLVYTGPPISKSTKEIEKTIPPIKDVNLSKTMSIIDKDIKNPMNLSQIKGRHGGYEGGGEPPHPEEHSKLDDKSGVNLSQISGRHGGTEPLGQPPHLEEHSLLDDGAGVPQLSNDLITLTKDLVNFKWTNYDNVGDNLSQIGGHHGGTLPGGQPPHSLDHSALDDGAGTPQSFYDGHSSVVTGQKTFERPNPKSLDQMESKFGPPSTQPNERGPYGVSDVMDGTKQGRGFIPPGGPPLGFTVDMGVSEYAIGDPLNYTLTPLSHTIAAVNSNGPHGSVPEHTIDIQFGTSWSNPEAINAWAEDFMTTPLANYESQYSEPVDSVTHQVDMITLTGPTVPDDDHYLNVTPKVDNAHGSDFMTLPISGYPGLYVGSQGDIVPIIPSVIGLGASDSIAASWPDKIFHQLGNLQDEKLYDVYQHHFLPTIENFNHISLLTDLFEDESISVATEKWRDGSVHIGTEDWAAPVGGGVTSWANLMPVTPRYSMFRDAQGNYQVPTLFPHEWVNQPTFNVLGGYPESTYGSGYTINSQFGYSWNNFLDEDAPLGPADVAAHYSSQHGLHSFEIGDINIDLYESLPKYHLATPLTIKWHLTDKNIEEWPYKQFGFSNSPEDNFNKDFLNIETSTGALVFATQPFIRRQAGQGYLDGRGTGVVGVDHLATVIARVEEDTTRINAWLNTPAGKNWHNNQYTLQNLNPRPETRTYNPGSLLISLVPHLHGQRHLSGFFGIFGPGKYGDLQTDMDYQEEGPGWDGKDTAGIWGYGTREAGSFDIGEKNRLTGLTAQFIGGAKPEEWKHLWNVFPSWDGGFWSAIRGMEDWSATNRGRTPEKPTQVVFSQMGAYGKGDASTRGTGGNVDKDERPHYSLSKYWSDQGLPQDAMLILTGHRLVEPFYLSLAYSHLDFEVAGYSPSLNAPFSRWNSGILENNWRFWPGTDVNSQKDLYWADKTPVPKGDEEKVKEHLESRVFTLSPYSHGSIAGKGTSWVDDSGGFKSAPHGPVSYWTLPYSNLDTNSAYAPTGEGMEFVSPLLAENWKYFDPANTKARNWHLSLTHWGSPRFHNEESFDIGSVSLIDSVAGRNQFWNDPSTNPVAVAGAQLAETKKIQALVDIAHAQNEKLASEKKAHEAAMMKFTAQVQTNRDEIEQREQEAATAREESGETIHDKLKDTGTVFTLHKYSHVGGLTKNLSIANAPYSLRRAFVQKKGIMQYNPFLTGYHIKGTVEYLTSPYNSLDISQGYGKSQWGALIRQDKWESDMISFSWQFFDSDEDIKGSHIDYYAKLPTDPTKSPFRKDESMAKQRVFTLSDKVAKGLGSDGIPSGDLLKQYSTLVYGNLNLQSAYDSNKDGLGALLSPSEFNLTDIPKIPALTKEMSERKIGQNIRKDIGEPGTTGIGPVTDTALGVIKKGIDGGKHVSVTADKVNMIPYGLDYTAADTEVGKKTSDFIKFKFFDVVNSQFIIFRAILSGISDSITPEWTGTRYIGRPDQVYVYNGAERKVSFTFDVYPKTKQELPVL